MSEQLLVKKTDATEFSDGGVPCVSVRGIGGMSLEKTFDCGQCFRFEASTHKQGAFEGVAFGEFLRVYQPEPDRIVLYNTDLDKYRRIWHRFFAFDHDWERIRADVASRAPELYAAAKVAGDIRILSQDRFEALVSFIISQCNNIPRIKGLVAALCRAYGEEIRTPEGERAYSFPTPESILAKPVSELTKLKVGYRDEFIYDAARAASEGLLDEISAADSTKKAEELVRSVRGVGGKVASCVLLFGFERYDAFPVDVWMKRAMLRLFGKVGNGSEFGPYAGVAQQYLFYCERYLGGAAE